MIDLNKLKYRFGNDISHMIDGSCGVAKCKLEEIIPLQMGTYLAAGGEGTVKPTTKFSEAIGTAYSDLKDGYVIVKLW